MKNSRKDRPARHFPRGEVGPTWRLLTSDEPASPPSSPTSFKSCRATGSTILSLLSAQPATQRRPGLIDWRLQEPPFAAV